MVQELVEISRFYGADTDYVIAGGGNTSFKDAAHLYIKGSGTSFAGIQAADFVKMDRSRLAAIWDKSYPLDAGQREAAVLADMMAAKCPGEEHKRPSVETLLHDLLPFAYVVHTHPALVNGLTCGQRGEQAVKELFTPANGGEAVWIPITNPGYVLSKRVKDAMDLYRAEKGKTPDIIFLQNHGVFVGADTVEGIKAAYQRIMDRLGSGIKRKPDLGREAASFGDSAGIGARLRDMASRFSGPGPWFTCFRRNAEILNYLKDEKSFFPVSSALTPDHIVYAGSDPFFVDEKTARDAAALEAAWKKHAAKTGRTPKLTAVQGLGIFGTGDSEKAAAAAAALFTDAVKVAVYAESFGGVLFMTKDHIDFINNWEVERYRSRVSAGK
jgi:rhamnose utilization protein RhaD (predicted bifunctional aldolase and dehydrogenase)